MKESPTAQVGVVEVQSLALDPRWNLARRIASSETFSKCARLSSFLLYVCECALSGRDHEINEQQIGVHVFGRSPGYNSNEDSVVRSQARLLRTRLDSYFQNEGFKESLVIRVPKGSYVPKFEPRELPEPAPESRLVPASPPVPRSRWDKTPRVAAAVLLACLVATALYLHFRTPPPPSANFWAQVFPSQRPTIIVPDDTALVLVQNFTHQTVNLTSYLNRSYLLDTGSFPTSAGAHRYTNITDLNFFARLSRLPAFNPDRVVIRYARDLQMADLRGANLVLIGARRANPWVELFDQKNTFQGLYTEERRDYILNRAPKDKEQAIYADNGPADAHRTYGLISFVPGVTGDESVLMVGGRDTPGTEGAANFLFSSAFEDFLTRAAGSRAKIRHFEILLRIGSLNGSAQSTEVVAYRLHDD
jgi:hypothetical protein